MDDCTDAHDLDGFGHNPRKRKRLQLPFVSPSGIDWTNFHPSLLHLRVYAAAMELSFHRLKAHAMQAVIASLGTLFDYGQFAAFIQELIMEENFRTLRDPAMNVITANLQRFKANDYTLIDDDLLGRVLFYVLGMIPFIVIHVVSPLRLRRRVSLYLVYRRLPRSLQFRQVA